jgi:hypothetical protein
MFKTSKEGGIKMAEEPLSQHEVEKLRGEQIQEPTFRLNVKESAKGFRYYEWTVKGDNFKELQERNEEIRKYVMRLREEDEKTENANPQGNLPEG